MPNRYSRREKIEREQEIILASTASLKIQAKQVLVNDERANNPKIQHLKRKLSKAGIKPNNDTDIISLILNRCFYLASQEIEQNTSPYFTNKIIKFVNKLENEVRHEYNYALKTAFKPLFRRSNTKDDVIYNSAIKDCLERLKLR